MYTFIVKLIFLFVIALVGAEALQAQQFLPPVERFSGSKPGFLLTKTGERVDFTLDDLDRKRGLIIKVSGKTTEGKKFTFQAAAIQQLCLAPSDAAKYMAFISSTQSIAKIQRHWSWRHGDYGRDGHVVLCQNERRKSNSAQEA